MRARPFLAVVLTAILVVFGLGLGTAWLLWTHSPLQLAHRQPGSLRAARFVPRQAPLSLHLFTDGEEPLAYARAVAAPTQRHQALDTLARLRDGAFAAAGLDYSNELQGWLAPEISVALLNLDDPDSEPGWLLALASRDDGGARRFLQRFWQTRSLAGTDLQVSRYRGMGLISGRGALVGQEPVPLATALIDDGLVLIASGRGVLEQALDVSQVDELNQGADPAFRRGVEQLGEATLLLQATPAALASWLGLPMPTGAAGPSGPLLAALRPEGSALALDALLPLAATADPGLNAILASVPGPSSSDTADQTTRAGEAATMAPPSSTDPSLEALLAASHGPSASLALIQDPAALLASPLLAPLVGLSGPRGDSGNPLPQLVLAGSHGPLLASRRGESWALGSGVADPDLEVLAAPLAAAGLSVAPLELQGQRAQVWTRLSTRADRSKRASEGSAGDQLQATVEGWRTVRDDQAWWGRSLADLQQAGRGHPDRQRLQQLERLGHPDAPLRWVSDGQEAQALLAPWRLWQRLTALAGGGLVEPVQGLALALEPQPAQLQLHARLELG